MTQGAWSLEELQSIELVNPGGMVVAGKTRLNPHPGTLEGKTILLRWNGKHNGDVFLNRIAELLAMQFNGVKFIKAWERFPETAATSLSHGRSQEYVRKLVEAGPDLSIAAYGD